MTVRVNKDSFNLREKLSELERPIGLKGNELMRAETAQEARELVGAGRKNMIINGAMQVAQRGTTITNVGIDTFTLDRWKQWASVGGQAGRSTATQETITDLEGFYTALKLQVTTTETPAANEVYGINTRLELQDILGLDIGGSNSKSLTLSFWAKAPTGNGTFCAGIFMTGGGHYVEEVTIGTTWSRHIINIPATTTSSHATTQTVNANTGMEIQITLMAGNNHDNSTNGAWGSGTGNRATSNQSNFYSSTSNNLWITGVQLEVSKNSTEFEHRSYGEELALCQRYFQKIGKEGHGGLGKNDYIASGFIDANGSAFYGGANLKVTMRTSPSISISGTASHLGYTQPAVAMPATGINNYWSNPQSYVINLGGTGSGTTGFGGYARITNDATQLEFNAEL